MGRPASIWWSDKRGEPGYFTGYKGLKRRLTFCEKDDKPHGTNYRAAEVAFDRLKEQLEEPDPKDDSFGLCLVRWWRHVDKGSLKTGKVARELFHDIADRMGHVSMSQVTKRMILDYVMNRASWGETTRAFALARLKTCLRWNVSGGYCSFNPLDKLKVADHAEQQARGEEYILPDGLKRLLLEEGNAAWRELLLALSMTGARPDELYRAERRHYVSADKIIVYRDHKTAKKLKRADKRRIIHLDDQADDIVRRNLRKGERLFPTLRGRQWNGSRAWEELHRALSKPKIVEWMHENNHDPAHVILYSFRHTFATDALLNGVSIAVLANLLGTSVKMIETHYSHALANVAAMRDAYQQAIGRKPAQ